MTIMDTNATQPATIVEDTEKKDINLAKPVTSVQNAYKKPEAPAKVEPKPEIKPPVATTKVEEKLSFHKEKFASYELVRLRLIQKGCIQYDPAFPELVLDTSDDRGKLLPLTPFFKSRIGITLEIVFK